MAFVFVIGERVQAFSGHPRCGREGWLEKWATRRNDSGGRRGVCGEGGDAARLRGVGDGGGRRFYAHVSSPRNGSMLEIARPAGEYEVSRLRFRQGLRSTPTPASLLFSRPEGGEKRKLAS